MVNMGNYIYKEIMKDILKHERAKNYSIFITNLIQSSTKEIFIPDDDFLFNHLSQFDFLEVSRKRNSKVIELRIAILKNKINEMRNVLENKSADKVLEETLRKNISESNERYNELMDIGNFEEANKHITRSNELTKEYLELVGKSSVGELNSLVTLVPNKTAYLSSIKVKVKDITERYQSLIIDGKTEEAQVLIDLSNSLTNKYLELMMAS